jgi:hypothetical protein
LFSKQGVEVAPKQAFNARGAYWTSDWPGTNREARQNPEEERLQILNSEIQELREELAELEALEEAESDWKCYERPRVKNQIMVREDERTKLVNNYNSLIRRQLVAEKPKIELRRAQSRVRF